MTRHDARRWDGAAALVLALGGLPLATSAEVSDAVHEIGVLLLCMAVVIGASIVIDVVAEVLRPDLDD